LLRTQDMEMCSLLVLDSNRENRKFKAAIVSNLYLSLISFAICKEIFTKGGFKFGSWNLYQIKE